MTTLPLIKIERRSKQHRSKHFGGKLIEFFYFSLERRSVHEYFENEEEGQKEHECGAGLGNSGNE